jgi:hypothetical protein
MPLKFSTRSRLERVLYTRESPHGTPYAVGLATDTEGKEHTILACSRRFGDLDHLRLLEGLDIDLEMTSSGPQVKPLSQQPAQVQEHLIEALEAGKGQMASDVRIPHVAKPLQQPEDREESALQGQHGTHLPKLCELATTVAHLAHELGLATAMWVHLPSE